MCGARMRSNSAGGTLPENTSRSVPRLSAPGRARPRLDFTPTPWLYPGPTRKTPGGRMLEPSTATVAAQAGIPVALRRALFAALVAAVTGGVLALATVALSPGGLDAVDLVLLALYAVALPWLLIGV